ncbi:MAG: hypothetical protein H6729_10840 [Deltaproteobacteria bacterium]|nr:hypothetical protein [Deltaproteobacteria bacterium]
MVAPVWWRSSFERVAPERSAVAPRPEQAQAFELGVRPHEQSSSRRRFEAQSSKTTLTASGSRSNRLSREVADVRVDESEPRGGRASRSGREAAGDERVSGSKSGANKAGWASAEHFAHQAAVLEERLRPVAGQYGFGSYGAAPSSMFAARGVASPVLAQRPALSLVPAPLSARSAPAGVSSRSSTVSLLSDVEETQVASALGSGGRRRAARARRGFLPAVDY